jgi:methyltransferase (TIGR00027 family)
MLTAADTAYSMAFIRALEKERPASERLFADPYAALFSAGGAHASEGTSLLLGLPFLVDAIRLRTRFVDDFVREGLASGVCQIVVLGAGLDARGLRLPEIAAGHASVYEVDFAEQLEKKRALLDAAGVRWPARIAAVGCDFMAPGFDDSLLVALGQSGFRRGERALFVWEGVLAYIDAAAVDRSLRFVVNAGGRGSRLVFDFAAGITFDPEPPAERLRGAGFTAFKAVGFDELWRQYRQPGEPHPNASSMQMGVAEV